MDKMDDIRNIHESIREIESFKTCKIENEILIKFETYNFYKNDIEKMRIRFIDKTLAITFLNDKDEVVESFYDDWNYNLDYLKNKLENLKQSKIIFDKCEKCSESIYDLIKMLLNIKHEIEDDVLKTLTNNIINKLNKEKLCLKCLFEKEFVEKYNSLWDIKIILKEIYKKVFNKEVEINENNIKGIIEEIEKHFLLRRNKITLDYLSHIDYDYEPETC